MQTAVRIFPLNRPILTSQGRKEKTEEEREKTRLRAANSRGLFDPVSPSPGIGGEM